MMDSKTANIVDVIKRIEYAEKKFCGCGYSHGKYVINKKTGLVDVPFGSVCMNFMTLYDLDDETIPIPFGVVKKNFDIKNSKNIKSLKNSPRKVGGYFDCSSNSFTTLEGSPEYVGGSFDCSANAELISLKGAPHEVGMFECENCFNLKSLKGLPEIIHNGIKLDARLLDPEKNEFADENKQILSKYTCPIKTYDRPDYDHFVHKVQ